MPGPVIRWNGRPATDTFSTFLACCSLQWLQSPGPWAPVPAPLPIVTPFSQEPMPQRVPTESPLFPRSRPSSQCSIASLAICCPAVLPILHRFPIHLSPGTDRSVDAVHAPLSLCSLHLLPTALPLPSITATRSHLGQGHCQPQAAPRRSAIDKGLLSCMYHIRRGGAAATLEKRGAKQAFSPPLITGTRLAHFVRGSPTARTLGPKIIVGW